MPIIKTIIHTPTGEFKNKQGLFECGPFEPQRPVLSVTNNITTYDPDYDVVVVSRIPDPRTEKWSGSAIVAKTSAEVAAYDEALIDAEIDTKLVGLLEHVILGIGKELKLPNPQAFVAAVKDHVKHERKVGKGPK